MNKNIEDNLNLIFAALGVLLIVLVNEKQIDLSLFYQIPIGILA